MSISSFFLTTYFHKNVFASAYTKYASDSIHERI